MILFYLGEIEPPPPSSGRVLLTLCFILKNICLNSKNIVVTSFFLNEVYVTIVELLFHLIIHIYC